MKHLDSVYAWVLQCTIHYGTVYLHEEWLNKIYDELRMLVVIRMVCLYSNDAVFSEIFINVCKSEKGWNEKYKTLNHSRRVVFVWAAAAACSSSQLRVSVWLSVA